MTTKNEMERAMMECAHIEQMTATEGWKIIEQYLENTIKVCNEVWLYLPSKSTKLEEIRQEAARCHGMLTLVRNFKDEGKRLWNLWAKLEGLVPETVMDMDNKSPNVEE